MACAYLGKRRRAVIVAYTTFSHLHIVPPRPTFTVRDVADLIGHDYPIDIIDVGEFVLQ